MTQAMRFKNGNAGVDFGVCNSNGNVEIVTYAGGFASSMFATEEDLREMRKWLTIQIRKSASVTASKSQPKK